MKTTEKVRREVKETRLIEGAKIDAIAEQATELAEAGVWQEEGIGVGPRTELWDSAKKFGIYPVVNLPSSQVLFLSKDLFLEMRERREYHDLAGYDFRFLDTLQMCEVLRAAEKSMKQAEQEMEVLLQKQVSVLESLGKGIVPNGGLEVATDDGRLALNRAGDYTITETDEDGCEQPARNLSRDEFMGLLSQSIESTREKKEDLIKGVANMIKNRQQLGPHLAMKAAELSR